MLRTLLLISFCTAFWAGAQNNIELSVNGEIGNIYEHSLRPDGSRFGLALKERRAIAFFGGIGCIYNAENFRFRLSVSKGEENLLNLFGPWKGSVGIGKELFLNQGWTNVKFSVFASYSFLYSKMKQLSGDVFEYQMSSFAPGIVYQWKFLQLEYHLHFLPNIYSDYPYRYEHEKNRRRLSLFKVGAFYKLGQ